MGPLGFVRTPALRFLVLAGVSGPLVAGCAAMPGSGPPKPVLVSDPSDGCRAYREEFAKSQTFFTEQIVADVAMGALIGGVVGVGVGLVTRTNVAQAGLIGAGVGGAAGGVSAYTKVMAEKHRDQLEMSKSVNADLTREGQEIDHTNATFARLRACRFEAATFIKTQVRRRALDRTTAMQQLDQQRRLFAEEIAVAKSYKITMDKRNEQFKDASDAIRQQALADAAQAQTAEAQAQAAKQAAGVSIPNKRSSYERSIASAETNSEIAFSLDNNKKVSGLRVGQASRA